MVREKSGKMEKVRETEICLMEFEQAEELKLQLLAACGLWTLDMFIIDTLVAFSKLVTICLL